MEPGKFIEEAFLAAKTNAAKSEVVTWECEAPN
jgi:hypothetical protein